ncbi:Hsp20/alpha crystallin family protein [Nocardioides sp. 1609]|uniref:Hsp20/alpha crystallin family protein n=1 Tax=Nocardioides sp. 1609 TaxID=2508327 RepID=UPI001ADA5A8D|nr:Hsp20/alpha crystallin family protein [Nocardioides sp. 1609]
MPPTSRRNPFEGITDFVSELSRMRTLGVHGSELGSEASERTHASAWLPTTDILARGDDVVIRIELAGVDPDDVHLQFHHGVLTVSGARRSAAGDGDDDVVFYVRERFHGEFRRVVTLPEGTEADDLGAEFDDGLVEITVRGAAVRGVGTRIALADRSRGRTSRAVDARDD